MHHLCESFDQASLDSPDTAGAPREERERILDEAAKAHQFFTDEWESHPVSTPRG